MIRLFTGLPGHGKTLRVVSELMEARAKDSARPLYVRGITGLTLDHATLDGPDWESCPDGSLIVIDEAQQVFPIRRSGEVPSFIQALATHRHRSIDIWLITQHPSLIDSFARKLINQHTHVFRVAGGELAQIYEWGEVQDDPRSMSARELSESHLWQFPKSNYGTYSSAVMHTAKFKIPKKVIFLGVAVVLLGLCVAFMASWVMSKKGVAVAPVMSSPIWQSAAGPLADRPGKPEIGPDEWLRLYTPRFAHRPESAPAYDNQLGNASPPQLACVDIEDGLDCRCYTEQGTVWKGVAHNTCRDLARNGVYRLKG